MGVQKMKKPRAGRGLMEQQGEKMLDEDVVRRAQAYPVGNKQFVADV